MNKIKVERYHDFSAGHKVTNHENKCKHLHGHNYRIYFTIEAKELDELGRVIDFSVIKSKLCNWLENHWDHRFLIYKNDPACLILTKHFPDDIILCDFNPTAENMGKYLCEVVGKKELKNTGCKLIKCKIQETRKCSAIYETSSK